MPDENHTPEMLYETAAEMLQAEGWDSDFRPDYSGRGMYGTTCPAIVTDAPAVVVGVAFCMAMDELGMSVGDPFRAVPQRSDNMGLSMVYY